MSPPSSFRVTKSKGTPKKRHNISSQTTPSPSVSPPISLGTYVENVWFDVIIQDQDDIAEIAFKRNFSPDFKQNTNGRALDYQGAHDLIFQLRSSFTNRQAVSSSVVVVPTPGNLEDRTGTVALSAHISGVQDGKEVTGKEASILQIGWNEKEMRRQVVLETVCLALS